MRVRRQYGASDQMDRVVVGRVPAACRFVRCAIACAEHSLIGDAPHPTGRHEYRACPGPPQERSATYSAASCLLLRLGSATPSLVCCPTRCRAGVAGRCASAVTVGYSGHDFAGESVA